MLNSRTSVVKTRGIICSTSSIDFIVGLVREMKRNQDYVGVTLTSGIHTYCLLKRQYRRMNFVKEDCPTNKDPWQ